MNQGPVFHSIILITTIVLIFTLQNYQNINATKENNKKNNSTESVIFIPFNSHIADQSINEKKYSGNFIPFP
ncbi:MAG: hypothetical protein M3Z01_05830 [Thermoproteota archaeon]|nr:hypothetical protein [Thermoproteota archaeon]